MVTSSSGIISVVPDGEELLAEALDECLPVLDGVPEAELLGGLPRLRVSVGDIHILPGLYDNDRRQTRCTKSSLEVSNCSQAHQGVRLNVDAGSTEPQCEVLVLHTEANPRVLHGHQLQPLLLSPLFGEERETAAKLGKLGQVEAVQDKEKVIKDDLLSLRLHLLLPTFTVGDNLFACDTVPLTGQSGGVLRVTQELTLVPLSSRLPHPHGYQGSTTL